MHKISWAWVPVYMPERCVCGRKNVFYGVLDKARKVELNM